MNNQPKINTTVALLLILVALSADAAGFIAILAQPIPVIGQFLFILAWIYSTSIWALILFYFIMKKISVRWMLGGGGIEFIPVINALPGLTAGTLFTILTDWYPAVGAVAIKPSPKLASLPTTPATESRPVPPARSAPIPSAAPITTPSVAPIASPTPSAQTPIPSGAPASAT